MKIISNLETITLKVHGEAKTFSEQELVEILEKFFKNEPIDNREKSTQMLAKVPTEGMWFEVNPQAINQKLFEGCRTDRRQEETRQLIIEAFKEVKKNPKKYGKPFKTIIPVKKWEDKTVAELKMYAEQLGDHMADWVEQCLEWAQRISNGESWETICNNPDTANWFRLVIWKHGYARLIGGSHACIYSSPASGVFSIEYLSNSRMVNTVPLVVA